MGSGMRHASRRHTRTDRCPCAADLLSSFPLSRIMATGLDKTQKALCEIMVKVCLRGRCSAEQAAA